jgi:hypothetical protein
MKSLYRRGAISGNQMRKMGGHREPDADDRRNGGKPAILRKTTSQRGRMTDFDGKAGKRDQGGVRDRGAVPGNEINHPTNQRAGAMPSRGARVNKGGQPSVRHIDEDQNPKFPSGASVKKNARPVGRQGLGGTSPGLRSSGPQYGGPSSRKYG